MIQIRCRAINLKPVNQAFTFIPSPQVSLIISITHSPHQIIIAKNIRFIALPKCGVSLTSIMAIAIKSTSRDSSAKDVGKGKVKFRFMMNQLTMIRLQKTPIFHLNAA